MKTLEEKIQHIIDNPPPPLPVAEELRRVREQREALLIKAEAHAGAEYMLRWVDAKISHLEKLQ